MAKVTFDVSDSDPAAAGSIEPPPPGVYRCKVKQCKPGFAKDGDGVDKSRPRLEVVYQVEEKGKHRGANLFDYIPTANPAAAWKFDQFLQAFDIATTKKRKGSFDTDDVVGELCLVRIVSGTYNGNYSPDVKAVLKFDEDDGDPSEDDEDEIDEDEDDDEIGEDDDDEDSDEEDDSEDEEIDDELLTEDDLMAMGVVALKKIGVADFDLTFPKTLKDKAKIVAMILEAQGGESEDEEDADTDYASWELAELKEECEARGLKSVGRKSVLVARLEENDGEAPF